MAVVMNGKLVAGHMLRALKEEVSRMGPRYIPGIATVLVGNRSDSKAYVYAKRRACRHVGIRCFHAELPEFCTPLQLLDTVKQFSSDDRVHGVLVQLPLPEHLQSYVDEVHRMIGVDKDVDGLHPLNFSKLVAGTDPTHLPCAASGVMQLLDYYRVGVAGKEAVVIGRSKLVGFPIALMLLQRDATVHVIHKQTVAKRDIVKRGDIVVVACGHPGLVQQDWVKPNAVVVDVGCTVVEHKNKRVHVGDVNFEAAKQVASMISPVPGGVGPMTIAMVVRNTVFSAKRFYGLS
eukprot:Rmarinus@m.23272